MDYTKEIKDILHGEDDIQPIFDHFGLFTEDRERIKEFLMTVPGAKILADRVVDFPQEIVTVGPPQKLSLYHIEVAGQDIEVIQPIECPDSYVAEVIKKHGGCFHHLALTFRTSAEHRKMCRILESKGYRCVLECTPRDLLVNYYEADNDEAIAFELKSTLER